MTPDEHTRQLTRIVLEHSEAKTIDKAFSEWSVEPYIRHDGTGESECVCGKKHIVYLYKIHNDLNGNVLFPIGSTCIKRFGSTSMDFAVDSLQKIYDFTHGSRRSLSEDALTYLLQHDVISAWEYSFLNGIRRKRNLSAKRIVKLSEIESKVEKWFSSLNNKEEKNTMKKKTTKKVSTKPTVKMNENEHRRMMKVNALKMAREIAARHMAELSTRIDEIREKYRKDYPANLDGLADEVQSTHNHIVAKCREELSQSGIGDYLNPEEVTMLINEEMLKALGH